MLILQDIINKKEKVLFHIRKENKIVALNNKIT